MEHQYKVLLTSNRQKKAYFGVYKTLAEVDALTIKGGEFYGYEASIEGSFSQYPYGLVERMYVEPFYEMPAIFKEGGIFHGYTD